MDTHYCHMNEMCPYEGEKPVWSKRLQEKIWLCCRCYDWLDDKLSEGNGNFMKRWKEYGLTPWRSL
jgi:hypothetical protein